MTEDQVLQEIGIKLPLGMNKESFCIVEARRDTIANVGSWLPDVHWVKVLKRGSFFILAINYFCDAIRNGYIEIVEDGRMAYKIKVSEEKVSAVPDENESEPKRKRGRPKGS